MENKNINVGKTLEGKVKYASIEATIIKADGTKVPLGVIAERHFTLFGLIKSKIKGLLKWK